MYNISVNIKEILKFEKSSYNVDQENFKKWELFLLVSTQYIFGAKLLKLEFLNNLIITLKS